MLGCMLGCHARNSLEGNPRKSYGNPKALGESLEILGRAKEGFDSAAQAEQSERTGLKRGSLNLIN